MQNNIQNIYKTIVENSNDIIILLDPLGTITEVNSKSEKLTGYTREELIGKHFTKLEMILKKDLPQMIKLFTDRAQEKKTDELFEYKIKHKNGQIIPIETNTQIIRKNGKIIGMISTIRDITKRKKAEEKLKENEEKYKTLYESSRDAIMILTPEKGFFSGNPATIKMFACKDEKEFTEQTPADLSPELQIDGQNSINKAQKMMQIAMSKGSHFFEWTHKRLNGEKFPATVLLTKMNLHGKEILHATVRDITKQKNSEEKLKESEEKFRKAILNSPYPIMLHAENGEVLQINEVWTKITGYSPSEIPTITKWTEKAYGKKQKFAKEYIDKLYALGKSKYDGTWEIKIKSGKKRFWDFNTAPIGKLSDGRRMVISTAVDVTKQKKYEKELEKRAEELEKFNKFAIDRELKMVELKKKIKELEEKK